jgi:hypothetical protein
MGIRAEMTKKKMRELGAISEETAKTPKELGVDEWFLKSGIAQIHGIKRTKDGRYYVKRALRSSKRNGSSNNACLIFPFSFYPFPYLIKCCAFRIKKLFKPGIKEFLFRIEE